MTDTQIAVIDTKALSRLEEWGGKRLVVQMIDLFMQHAPERVEALRDGLQMGEVEGVERAAHSLKSTAANLGAEALSSVAARAEHAAGEGDLAVVRELFSTIEAEFLRAKEALAVLEQGEL